MKQIHISWYTLCALVVACFASINTQDVHAQHTSKLYQQWEEDPQSSPLIDFSMAGYQFGDKAYQYPKRIVNVTKHGIFPNTGKDVTRAVNKLLTRLGQNGGAVVFFPAGKYIFNTNPNKLNCIHIDYDNIVIRGEGQGTDGTVFYNATRLLNLGTNPWLSPGLIHVGNRIQSYKRFWGAAPLNVQYGSEIDATNINASKSTDSINEQEMTTAVIESAKKGDFKLKVASTDGLHAGDVILLAEYNTNGNCDLIKELLNYTDKEFTDELINAKKAGEQGIASYQVLMEIEHVISKEMLQLRQPLKRDINTKYQPKISRVEMLHNIGVENLRIEHAWDGNYKHHKNREVDYGWNGINYTRVAHGWIKDVTVDNSTNPIYLVDSRNVTVENIHTLGEMGHCGIKLYAHCNDNLIRNVVMDADYTHGLSLEGNCYGNVFTGCKLNNQDYGPGFFDFHGFSHFTYSPPAQNLFELCDGFNSISGGGAIQNFPHTGINNVWWNDNSKLYNTTDKHGQKEAFHHWIWSREGMPHRTDHHISYAQSILAGFRAVDGKLVVDGLDKDRHEPLVIVESLNKEVYPTSLYEAQKKARISSAVSLYGPTINMLQDNSLDAWEAWMPEQGRVAPKKLASIHKGTLQMHGKEGGYLISKQVFADFELTAQYKWNTRAAKRNGMGKVLNSGLMYRVPVQTPDSWFPRGYQCQIKTGNTGDFILLKQAALHVQGQDITPGKSVVVPRMQNIELSSKKWHTIRIVCHQDTIRQYIDGILVNEGTEASERVGHILLCYERGPIDFRNIQVKELHPTWDMVFHSSLCEQDTAAWRKDFFLDGLHAEVQNSPDGLSFRAGHDGFSHEDHSVLWTKQSFEDNIKVEYDFRRDDDAHKDNVCILYLLAEGIGQAPFKQDISQWNTLRRTPYMYIYFWGMRLAHISYATRSIGNDAYIRCRTYPMETGKTVWPELVVPPSYNNDRLFKPHQWHHVEATKRDDLLTFHVTGDGQDKTYVWHNPRLGAITQGRIGFRQMQGRDSSYKNLKVYQLAK